MSTFADYKREDKPELTTEDQLVTVTFRKMTEVVEKDTDKTIGFYVKNDKFKDMWVPFFGPGEDNKELENLQDELGITREESNDLRAYNAKAGTKIVVSGVKNKTFTNAHFGSSTKSE